MSYGMTNPQQTFQQAKGECTHQVKPCLGRCIETLCVAQVRHLIRPGWCMLNLVGLAARAWQWSTSGQPARLASTPACCTTVQGCGGHQTCRKGPAVSQACCIPFCSSAVSDASSSSASSWLRFFPFFCLLLPAALGAAAPLGKVDLKLQHIMHDAQ